MNEEQKKAIKSIIEQEKRVLAGLHNSINEHRRWLEEYEKKAKVSEVMIKGLEAGYEEKGKTLTIDEMKLKVAKHEIARIESRSDE